MTGSPPPPRRLPRDGLGGHGPVVVSDVFVNADPDDLVVAVEVENRSASPWELRVGIRAVGAVADLDAFVGPGEVAVVEARLGSTPAARWSPHTPVLHGCLVEAHAAGALSDARSVRFGLRRIRIEGDRLTIEGQPHRMRTALVAGPGPDCRHAEADRAGVEAVVRAALAMGFNTLRLGAEVFDPVHLDVCDELGMVVQRDLPVAEPDAGEETGPGDELARRCVAATTEQVRRDRNHPSIALWSATDRLRPERAEAGDRPTAGQLNATVVAAVRASDPTRPVIGDDRSVPGPGRASAGDAVGAHWYGRLDADRLDRMEAACAGWAGRGRPLFVTVSGGRAPRVPVAADGRLPGAGDRHAAGLAAARWPATVARFVAETQRYQGLSDRLQAEVLRRHDHIGGYCVTELTDVHADLDGLLDLQRDPRPMAVAERARANQAVLPMLHLGGLVVVAEDLVRAPVHVANDGPPLPDVEVEARFAGVPPAFGVGELEDVDARGLPVSPVMARFNESVAAVRADELAGWRATGLGEATLVVPEVPGNHDLVLTLRSEGRVVSTNRYPIHVVPAPDAPYAVQARGGDGVAEALAAVGAKVGDDGPTFVAEGGLDDGVAAEVRDRLAAGGTVVVLAQPPSAAARYPVPAVLEPVETAWGSTVFSFTTSSGRLPSLPRRNLLVAEDSTVSAVAVVAAIDGRAFPDEPVVIAYEPVPGALAATVVGSHAVGPGRLVVCQYRLTRRALAGDAAARALLADLVRWAADPRPPMGVEEVRKDDGRSMTYYSFPPGWDR